MITSLSLTLSDVQVRTMNSTWIRTWDTRYLSTGSDGPHFTTKYSSPVVQIGVLGKTKKSGIFPKTCPKLVHPQNLQGKTP